MVGDAHPTPMVNFLGIFAVALGVLSGIWLPLFLLSWREARQSVALFDEQELIEDRVQMPKPRLIHYFTILPLHFLIYLFIWPLIAGNRIGRKRRPRI
jgi:hypothetical protein